MLKRVEQERAENVKRYRRYGAFSWEPMRIWGNEEADSGLVAWLDKFENEVGAQVFDII